MQRIGKQFLRRSELNDLPRIHNRHAVCNLRHNTKIMRNQNNACLMFLLEVFDKVEDLGLNSYIKRSCRLIRNDERRITRKGSCNQHPLPHTA